MRFVVTQFFEKSPLLVFPLLGLVLFIAVFAIVLVRTLGRRGRSLQAYAWLPLEKQPEVDEQ
jgi:hypothetical protein